MMAVKSLVVVCFVLASVLCDDEKYTDKYDNLDLDEIINNTRLFEGYYKCIMETGKCTPEGKELKEHLLDALQTECAKCTEAQKQGTAKVIKHLVNNEKEKWDELCKKYDPTGQYRKMYEDRAKQEGIEIPKE